MMPKSLHFEVPALTEKEGINCLNYTLKGSKKLISLPSYLPIGVDVLIYQCLSGGVVSLRSGLREAWGVADPYRVEIIWLTCYFCRGVRVNYLEWSNANLGGGLWYEGRTNS